MIPEHITWLYLPTAVALGALHALEPGHSKTMMAAFIIAIRGTITQAVLLGLSAAISHSLVIWLLAAGALYLGSRWTAESIEPYLQLGSAAAVLLLAVWMFRRTSRELGEAHEHHHHSHGHDEVRLLETPGGSVELSVFEEGMPPVFRLHAPAGQPLPQAAAVTIETVRPDGLQAFTFTAHDGFLESNETIPEPHEFEVELTLRYGSRSHTARTEFHEHAHDDAEYQDAHEREHAEEIRQRFHGRAVTTPQLVMFGVTGGLMPCPAAFSILLICLQLKRTTLGFAMVAAFSLGLALTMVTAGVLAAWSVQHAQRKFRGFGEAMRRAPYVSCALLVIIAAYMAWHGWKALPAH